MTAQIGKRASMQLNPIDYFSLKKSAKSDIITSGKCITEICTFVRRVSIVNAP